MMGTRNKAIAPHGFFFFDGFVPVETELDVVVMFGILLNRVERDEILTTLHCNVFLQTTQCKGWSPGIQWLNRQ